MNSSKGLSIRHLPTPDQVMLRSFLPDPGFSEMYDLIIGSSCGFCNSFGHCGVRMN